MTLSWQIGCQQPRQTLAPVHPVIYPLPPSPARVVFVATIRGAADVGLKPRPMAEFLFGYDPKSVPAISKPFGLATQGSALYVCDTQQNVVHVLDFGAQTLVSFGRHGAGRLLKPVDVAVDQDGRRYVADTGRRQVVVFAPDNRPIRQFGSLTRAEDFKPVALALRGPRLYVVNGQQHRVEILDAETGVRIGLIGTRGDQPGEFNFPNGIALDTDENVCVADMLNYRVQVFSPQRELIRTFGRPGDRAGQFARPRRLAIGPDGITYVHGRGFSARPHVRPRRAGAHVVRRHGHRSRRHDAPGRHLHQPRAA